MKPEFKNREDIIAQKTSERVVEAMEKKVDEKLSSIKQDIDLIKEGQKPKEAGASSKEAGASSKEAGASSKEAKDAIKKIIEDAKNRRKIENIKDILVKKSEVASEGSGTSGISSMAGVTHDNTFDCPMCHKHSMEIHPETMLAKCAGPGCNQEFVMVAKNSDYKCLGCGIPIKRPVEGQPMPSSCPFCGHDKARQFDWSLMIKK